MVWRRYANALEWHHVVILERRYMGINEQEMLSIYVSIAEVAFSCTRPYWKSMGFFPRNSNDLSALASQFCLDMLKDRKSQSYSEASVVEKFLNLHSKHLGTAETEYFVCWVKGVNKPPFATSRQMYAWRSALIKISREGMYAEEPIGIVASRWKLARPSEVVPVKLSDHDEAIAHEWFTDEYMDPYLTIQFAGGKFAFFATWTRFVEDLALNDAQRVSLLEQGQAIDPSLGNPFEMFILPELLRSRMS